MMPKLLLTNGIDVEEAHGRSEYGVEHAVVQRLCARHQHLEQGQIPDKAENDGGSSQACWKQQQHILLYLSEISHSRHSTGDMLSRGNDDVRFTSINAQVEICIQLFGDVLSILDDGAVGL